jgi:hypothetical protein
MISDPAALAAEISDAQTPSQRLVEIAGSFPEFGPVVAEHPNASLDVLSFLLKHGDEPTRKAAARRRARDVAQITMDASQAIIAKPSAQSGAVVKTPEAASSPDASNSAEVSTSAAAFRAPASSDEDVDHTVLSARSQPRRWRIVLEDQEDIPVSSSDLLIGRKPQARAEFAGAELVTVSDPTKTVSKTHARMMLRDDTWFIVDLSSTNGVFLERPDGEHRVVAGTEIEVVGPFSLGDLRMHLTLES